ncbi:hypothetical protein Bbelb_037240 [Branchiostoma belcheri]|nr:hypothetical protein Bbelb_037240 [Branchiostoma belcheri]
MASFPQPGALSAAGASLKVRRIIEAIFSVATGCVCVTSPNGNQELSEPFKISRVTTSRLQYADDAGLIDGCVQEASERISAIASGFRDDSDMEIPVPKTKAMHIHRKNRVSRTTETLDLKHRCPEIFQQPTHMEGPQTPAFTENTPTQIILTCSCEAWDLTQDVTKMINGFNSRCPRVITKKPFRETAANPT